MPTRNHASRGLGMQSTIKQLSKDGMYCGFRMPAKLIEEIDNAAGKELTTRSAWLRRAALRELGCQHGGRPAVGANA